MIRFRKLRVPKSTAVSVEAMACVPISAAGHDVAAEIGGKGGESHRWVSISERLSFPISLAHKEMGTVMSLVATDSFGSYRWRAQRADRNVGTTSGGLVIPICQILHRVEKHRNSDPFPVRDVFHP